MVIPLQLSSFQDDDTNARAGELYSSLVERYGVGRAMAITWATLRKEGWILTKETPKAPIQEPQPVPQPKPKTPEQPSLFSEEELKYSKERKRVQGEDPITFPGEISILNTAGFKASLLKKRAGLYNPRVPQGEERNGRNWALLNTGSVMVPLFGEPTSVTVDVYQDFNQGLAKDPVPPVKQVQVIARHFFSMFVGMDCTLLFDCPGPETHDAIIYFKERPENLKVVGEALGVELIKKIKENKTFRDQLKRRFLEDGTMMDQPEEILIALGPGAPPPEEDD